MTKSNKLRVLVLCHDVVGKNMAGPGIRYQNIARVLGKHFKVTLGVFSGKNRDTNEIALVNPDSHGYKKYFDDNDVIFAQWLSQAMIDYAGRTGKIIVFDFYAPVPIEYLANLEFSTREITTRQEEEFENIIEMYKNYLTQGQIFTCSNERQRDFWTGYLVSSNLFGPVDFKKNKISNNFLLCPMGVDSKQITQKDLLLRNKVKGIAKDDFVLLWTGGIWDWFDAQLIVRAMSKIKDPSIKLVFLGTKHPNKIYKDEMRESISARHLSEKLGLLNKTVFFLENWVPYKDRGAYFEDADVAIYADKESLETRFSHRTRVLDHFWSGLPTICSAGDYMSEIISKKEFGIVVRERAPEAFADAIISLRKNPKLYKKIKSNLRDHRLEFSWEHTMEPLVQRLKNIDLPIARKQVIKQYNESIKGRKMSLKSRVRRSAKILLLGQ